MINDSKIVVFLVIGLLGIFTNNFQETALIMGLIYIANVLVYSKNQIAFREYTLAIYGINYLISPAILYNYNDADFLPYHMNCPKEQYFQIAISGILSLHLGLYAFKTNIFKTSFTLAKIQAQLNSKVFRTWVLVGLVLNFIVTNVAVPTEIALFLLLLSGLRYVGFFALITIDFKKNKTLIFSVVLYEFYWALSNGFFHDLMVWLIFFGLYICFLKKIKIGTKVTLMLILIFFGFMIQNIKADYRQKIWSEGGGDDFVGSFSDVADKKSQNTDLFSEQTVITTLIRVNQAWIAASTIDYMDRTQKFAGTLLLYKYIEAAILPRFIAQNKLQSGDKEIFNTYSGHTISKGTSMGLGIIADGYIGFAFWGVVFYCFGLGLVFTFVFYMVDKWSKVTPFFVLMLFPILYYAVRPDCELQTTLAHMVKGTFTYWLVVLYYKKYFLTQSKVIERIDAFIEARKIEMAKRFNRE